MLKFVVITNSLLLEHFWKYSHIRRSYWEFGPCWINSLFCCPDKILTTNPYRVQEILVCELVSWPLWSLLSCPPSQEHEQHTILFLFAVLRVLILMLILF